MARILTPVVRNLRKVCVALCCALLLLSQLFISSPDTASTSAAAAATATVAAAARQGDPSVVGQWSPPLELTVTVIHAHMLPNGMVLMWDRPQDWWNGGDALGFSQTYVLDTNMNFMSFPFNSTTNLFCSGHAFLPDGRLLVTGGHKQFDGVGEPHTNFYDANTDTWTRGPDMNAGRWYPTTTSLANGEAVVVSGNVGANGVNNNTLPQVFQTNGTWRNLTSAQLGLQLYPWMLLAPNGRVFNAGPDQFTRYLAPANAGAWYGGPTSNGGFRDYGSTVMYDDGKVLIAGGGPPTNSAEVINLSRENPAWRFVNGMAFTRRQMNMTLLADGQVLVTGGTSGGGFTNAVGSVHNAEIWNPDTEGWSVMSAMQTRRLYHSMAMLLPDGRVMVAGGGWPASSGGDFNHTDVEIFSPPYLFRGPRPTITSAPASAAHNQQFFVGTPDGASISKVTLVRLSSVTHSFNQNQRINYLSFHQTAGGINVHAPGAGSVAPPGHYMMFLVNSNGVPSVASIIQITNGTRLNAIDDQRYFVRQHYYDFFNREPQPDGLVFWTRNITQCGNNQSCIGGMRTNTSRAFWESGEFQNPLRASGDPLFNPTPPNGLPYNTQEFVKWCYRIYLRREADSGGLSFWTNGLNNCIANNPNNTSQCYNNTISAFLAAGDYRNRFYKPS